MYLVYIVTICNRAGHHILVISGCPEGVLVYQGMTDMLPMFGHLGCLSVVNVLNHDFNVILGYILRYRIGESQSNYTSVFEKSPYHS